MISLGSESGRERTEMTDLRRGCRATSGARSDSHECVCVCVRIGGIKRQRRKAAGQRPLR